MDYKKIFGYPLRVIRGERTLGQALNYIHYRLSTPSPVVRYSPVVLNFFPTDKCNLRCDFCLTRSTKFENKEFKHYPCQDMSFELFKQVLDKFDKAFEVQIAGTGEPTLNKDIFRMIEYCTQKKMEAFMNTNGTIIENKIEQLVCSGLTTLWISLNAHNADEFSRITGEDGKYFYKICDNIRALVETRREKKSDIKFGASIILDKINYRYINEMIQTAGMLGLDYVTFYPFFPVSENEDFSASKRCLFEDDKEVAEFFPAKVKYPSSGLQVIICPFPKRVVARRGCRSFFKLLSIDGAGNVGGCAKQILNLTGGKFSDEDVWNNQYFRSMRQMFLDPNTPLLETCKFCAGQFEEW
jgi:MoaA/NifB/PqqE/SkfB family radical SAM enzyme